ncbi:hypothetical protein SCHPADRAFT_220645 [Schizopora paradoxa]|uniref:Uncharacterized protein n=1 Tax=Schizopora paradoxa TaxID=27342 RepID=A0A0H2RX89_9AGAM|nr:hypothetical protein SCHPADRAFT_220645 [Schizopora paradoxa]
MSSYIPTKMQKMIPLEDLPLAETNEQPASFLNYAYDTYLETYIPFDNSSDAMIASLALAYNLPTEHVDLFLSLILDSDFDGSEVTLRSSPDIYARVRQHRIRETIRKSDRSINNSVFNNIVLGSVIDVLEDDIMHFKGLKNKLYLDINEGRDYDRWAVKAKEAKETLSAMSRVHPSWTEPARHALGRAINVKCEVSHLKNGSENEMERIALRSPLYGPWTRYLSLQAVSSWGGDRWDYLFCMARKLTNVRSLNLSFPILNNEMTELALVFISSLKSVEDLILEDVSETQNDGLLHTLLPRLSRLPRLKKIRLPGNSRFLLDAPLPQNISKARTSNLLDIQFCLQISSSNPNLTHIAWSRQDIDDQFALSDLVLASRPPASPPLENIKSLESSLNSLASLALETVSKKDSIKVLRKCKSLRKLSIMSYDFPPAEVFKNIPRTLEYLSIVSTSQNMSENSSGVDWDRRLSSLLSIKRTPMLRELRVSRLHLKRLSSEVEPISFDLGLPLTKLSCETRGIDFDEDLNWKWKGASFAEVKLED